jgi:hypothetical protein
VDVDVTPVEQEVEGQVAVMEGRYHDPLQETQRQVARTLDAYYLADDQRRIPNVGAVKHGHAATEKLAALLSLPS